MPATREDRPSALSARDRLGNTRQIPVDKSCGETAGSCEARSWVGYAIGGSGSVQMAGTDARAPYGWLGGPVFAQ